MENDNFLKTNILSFAVPKTSILFLIGLHPRTCQGIHAHFVSSRTIRLHPHLQRVVNTNFEASIGKIYFLIEFEEMKTQHPRSFEIDALNFTEFMKYIAYRYHLIRKKNIQTHNASNILRFILPHVFINIYIILITIMYH